MLDKLRTHYQTPRVLGRRNGLKTGCPFFSSDIDVFVIARNEEEFKRKIKAIYDKVRLLAVARVCSRFC